MGADGWTRTTATRRKARPLPTEVHLPSPYAYDESAITDRMRLPTAVPDGSVA